MTVGLFGDLIFLWSIVQRGPHHLVCSVFALVIVFSSYLNVTLYFHGMMSGL